LKDEHNRSFLGERSPRKSVTGPLGDGQVPNAEALRRQARTGLGSAIKGLGAAMLEADWGPSASKHQYVYSDNHVYFVEPSSRKVVTVID
jgi:hypothetical protein